MRLLAIIIVAVGAYSGWVLLQKEQTRRVNEGWAQQCAEVIRAQATGKAAPGAGTTPDEASFFKALHFLQKAERSQRDLYAVVGDACTQLGITGGQKGLVQDALLANYESARKMKLFDDPMNLVRMEQGQPPLMVLAGWEGEPLGVGVVIPPMHAHELANHLVNLVLMPVSVRDAQTDRVTREMTETARKFEQAGVLPRATLESINFAARSAR